MKYRLVALDVDGTLVRPDQTVPQETVEAIHAAIAAGMRVCLATGRNYAETMPVWRQLKLTKPYQPMILVGGALISEADTGRTLYQRTVAPDVAAAYCQTLKDRGYSAVVVVDPWRWGVDYLVVESDDIDSLRRRWFAQIPGVKIRTVHRLGEGGNEPGVLRLNAMVEPRDAEELTESMRRQFEGRLNLHSILAPNYGVTVMEAFAPEVSKWSAILYVAEGLSVPPSAVVAVGDDVNDLSMLSAAGLGAAMAKAPLHVQAQADHVIHGSLAEFIRSLLET